eukprot:3740254-Pleurochrysis_carterae.AAC.2
MLWCYRLPSLSALVCMEAVGTQVWPCATCNDCMSAVLLSVLLKLLCIAAIQAGGSMWRSRQT